ncbi:MAG: hypothetical protein ACKPKO_25730, partial [Candidatus Fonsibacter sp.]
HGKWAQASVWAQIHDKEYARAKGLPGASLRIGLSKAYEFVGHNLAAWNARESGFPLSIDRMALLLSGSQRVVRICQACSEVARITTSIVAGCSHATAFLKAVL